MARTRKNFEKKFELGNFVLKLDIYKEKVVFFKLVFNVERNTNEIISIEHLKKTLQSLLEDKFRYINGRKLFDIGDETTIRGYISHFELKGFFWVFDNYEDKIKTTCDSMLPLLQEIFGNMGFRCVKAIKYTKKNV